MLCCKTCPSRCGLDLQTGYEPDIERHDESSKELPMTTVQTVFLQALCHVALGPIKKLLGRTCTRVIVLGHTSDPNSVLSRYYQQLKVISGGQLLQGLRCAATDPDKR